MTFGHLQTIAHEEAVSETTEREIVVLITARQLSVAFLYGLFIVFAVLGRSSVICKLKNIHLNRVNEHACIWSQCQIFKGCHKNKFTYNLSIENTEDCFSLRRYAN